jgi:hypothetical protein
MERRARVVAATVLFLAAVAIGRPGTDVLAQAPSLEREVDGTLDVLYEDAETGSRLLHVLQTDRGRVPLRFPRGNPPDLP